METLHSVNCSLALLVNSFLESYDKLERERKLFFHAIFKHGNCMIFL